MTDSYKTDWEPATGRIDCLPLPTTRNQGWPGVYAVLYTDSINGEQTCRDDLWVATTGAINAVVERAQHEAYAEGRKDQREEGGELLQRVTKALADLSFECFGGIGTTRPSVETYNRTFDVLQEARAALALSA